MFPSMSIEEMLDLSDIEVTKNIGLSIGFIYALKHENIELLQFTGLLDKNGKEIYEGDICKNGGGKTIIEWDNEVAGFDFTNSEGAVLSGDLFEVIGNVYENPELLK